jgi:hypothetical protein
MARAAASDALERLLSSSPELAAILGPTFHAGMMERFDRANEKHWLILTSKMLSLSDLVLD